MTAIIFDIDGTLSDLTHRLHHISGTSRKWDEFFDAASDDAPHNEIIELNKILKNAGKTIFVVSGRPEKIRGITEEWLSNHGVVYDELYMRPDGDHRQDFLVKSQILDGILADNYEIDFVIDDRDTVVEMWRERGIVCLQCREWRESKPERPNGLLTLMIGPSGAGKTTWLKSDEAKVYNIHPSHVVSSDQIRHDLCGDFKDQSKNDEVFVALHAVAKTRIENGLATVIDATNLKRKDRLACVDLAKGGPVRYFVVDRPMEDKKRDGGWRNELSIDLLAKHQQTFNSQIKDILGGDGQPNVQFVIDLRRHK